MEFVGRAGGAAQTPNLQFRGALSTPSFQVPFLKDPNTGIQLFESPDIIDYLEEVYTT